MERWIGQRERGGPRRAPPRGTRGWYVGRYRKDTRAVQRAMDRVLQQQEVFDEGGNPRAPWRRQTDAGRDRMLDRRVARMRKDSRGLLRRARIAKKKWGDWVNPAILDF